MPSLNVSQVTTQMTAALKGRGFSVQATPWVSGQTTRRDTIVQHASKLWLALETNSLEPSLSPAGKWLVWQDFSQAEAAAVHAANAQSSAGVAAQARNEVVASSETLGSGFQTSGDNALLRIVDAQNKTIGVVDERSQWKIILEKIVTGSGLEIYELETTDNLVAIIVDGDGKEILRFEQNMNDRLETIDNDIALAAGSRASLSDRINQSITPYGAPKQANWGLWYLRETRQRLRKRLLDESAQLVAAAIGDSWTHNHSRWTGPVATALMSAYGDAGGGWLGFGSNSGTFDNGNVRPVSYTYSRSGTWIFTSYGTSVGPDVCQITSSSAGAKVSLAGPATPVLSVAKLFWVGTADGVVRYRWNSGSWTTLNVQGVGLQSENLSGLPVSGSWTLEIEVVSGTCTLCGIDYQSEANGVRFHKLGATGSRAQQWAAVDAENWQAGITALAPHLVMIMHGTNDQSSARSPVNFAADMTTIIGRIRSARPAADVFIVMPCENNRTTNAVPMSAYSAAAYDVAVQQNCAFMDLQYYFGDNPDDYSSASNRPWFNADLVHPEPLTGGRAIIDAVMRALIQ